jgi:cell division protein FtsQ
VRDAAGSGALGQLKLDMATRRTPNTAKAAVLPVDVRLMNSAARWLFVLGVIAMLAVGAKALARSQAFNLKAIQIEGDLQRTTVATVRKLALPQIQGNFFSIDLQAAQAAFEAVPWVRHAVVRRAWPNRLNVQLEEHHVAALWKSEAGDDRLVNQQGEVFDANLGEVDGDALATLQGPDGFSAPMLSLLGQLNLALAPLNTGVEELRLTLRGSWKAELASGAVIELGRGNEAEVMERVGRFVRTLSAASAQVNATPQALRHADLRHSGAYAIRLAGISTNKPATAPQTPRTP